MIKVKLVRNPAGLMTAFSVTGHAHTAPRGQDIVCAGVSALTQTAFLGLSQHLERQVSFVMKSGELALEIAEPDELTSAILETMVLGLQEIAQNYPTSVQIKEHRR